MPRKIEFLDERIVDTVSGYASTTHLNNLGYKLTRRQLQQMSRNAPKRPFFYVGHDTDNPPIGKVVKAEVRRLEDGEYGLWVKIEVYDEAGLQAIKRNRGLSIGLRTGPVEGFD